MNALGYVMLAVAVVAIVAVLALRKRLATFIFRIGNSEVRAEARKAPGRGVLVEDAKSGGSVSAMDHTGAGATVRKTEAAGDITASATDQLPKV